MYLFGGLYEQLIVHTVEPVLTHNTLIIPVLPVVRDLFIYLYQWIVEYGSRLQKDRKKIRIPEEIRYLNYFDWRETKKYFHFSDVWPLYSLQKLLHNDKERNFLERSFLVDLLD